MLMCCCAAVFLFVLLYSLLKIPIMKAIEPKSQKLGIKHWAEEDRPREKMLLKGKEVLSDAELMAILIGSGNAQETAVDLCKRILKDLSNNNLNELSKKNVSDLMTFKGIGQAKALTIVAALELGRRRQLAKASVRKQITSSRDVFNALQPILGDLPHEEFWILYLNRSNKIITKERISLGGVAGTVADVKIIYKKALQALACGIIAAHNHPSGNLRPSQADIQLTQKMIEAGKFLDINLLDHVIVTDAGYYSFADEGLI